MSSEAIQRDKKCLDGASTRLQERKLLQLYAVLLGYGVSEISAVQIPHRKLAKTTSSQTLALILLRFQFMDYLSVYLPLLLVDVICISIGICPQTPGSICWALWSSIPPRTRPTPSMSAYRLKVATKWLLRIAYVAWALHLVLNKDELLFAFLTVAQCLLATGQKSELLAARLLREAPVVSKGTPLLVMALLFYLAYRAMPLRCQKVRRLLVCLFRRVCDSSFAAASGMP